MTALAVRRVVVNALAEVFVAPRLPASPLGRPRTTEWHPREPGFGTRRYSSGREVYVVQAPMGGAPKTVTIGPACLMTIHQARSVARLALAWSRVGFDPALERKRTRQAPAFADFVEEYWLRCSPRWKPSSLRTNIIYRRRYLDGAFPGRFVDEVSQADVARWFTATTDRAGPGGANRAMVMLMAAFYKAGRWGYRPEGDNPCTGIRPNRTKPMERHLSTGELARLGAVLVRVRSGLRSLPFHLRFRDPVADADRVQARRSDVGAEERYPGPSTAPARQQDGTSHRVARSGSAEGNRRAAADEGRRLAVLDSGSGKVIRYPQAVWHAVRKEAGLGKARLHDLRHTFASQAAMGSDTLPMVARLLGHASIGSTMRYAHQDDAQLLDAAEQVSELVARMMDGETGARRRPHLTLS